MELLIWFAGVIIGAFLMWIFYRKPKGSLIVDLSDPESGIFKLMVYDRADVERIAKKQRIVLKVEKR